MCISLHKLINPIMFSDLHLQTCVYISDLKQYQDVRKFVVPRGTPETDFRSEDNEKPGRDTWSVKSYIDVGQIFSEGLKDLVELIQALGPQISSGMEVPEKSS